MGRYDTRNVCNHRVFVRIVCIALVTWTLPSWANDNSPYWIETSHNQVGYCRFESYETEVTQALIEQCKSELERYLHLSSGNNVYHITYLTDVYDISLGWGEFTGNRAYNKHQLINPNNTQNCQVGQTPVYPAVDCEPPPPKCDDPDIQKDFQNAQYACQIGNPNIQLWETKFEWSCTDVIGQQPNIVSNCSYIPNGCIVGLTCDKAGKDTPYCNPNNEQCDLPPPTPDLAQEPPPNPPPNEGTNNGSGNGESGTGSNPPMPNFCDTHPHLCEKPTSPEANPEPNPTPEEKPDNPDLSPGENDIIQEISLSNQHLENVNANVKSMNEQLLEQLTKGNEFSQHQLGVLRELLKQLHSGSDTVTTPSEEETTDEETPVKPMASADCHKSIFECRGDVIQCALLKLKYEESCTVDELTQLEDAFAGIKQLDNEALLVQAESVDLSKIDTQYLNSGVSFGSNGCPAPERISFRAFGEHKTLEFKFDPACHYAELLRPLLIAFAWLTGLFIIGRSQGAV